MDGPAFACFKPALVKQTKTLQATEITILFFWLYVFFLFVSKDLLSCMKPFLFKIEGILK